MMGSGSLWSSFISAALLGILLFHGSCLSEKAPYRSFAHYATSAPPKVYFDYIVIGGGTAGCALAATLSERANVLVLERGDLPYGIPSVNKMATFGVTLANLSPSSPSQAFVSTDGVFSARARVLGGGSCLNAGFYSRASNRFVTRAGWDKRLVNESYEWVERKLVFEPPMLQWQSAVKAGLLEVGVLPDNGFTFDHIYGTKIGGTIFDENGQRHSAANLLEYADPKKITVYLKATVHRVIFDTKGQKPKASGVEFSDSLGQMHTAYLKAGPSNEIVLSAGALGSPQLLMLSGVGPKEHLMAQGIDVVLDQPMVGQEMSDNPMNALIVPSPSPVEMSLIQVAGITPTDNYVETASGSLLGFIGQSALDRFYQLLGNTSGHSIARIPSHLISLLRLPQNAGIIVEKTSGPHSTGHLELKNRDPRENPIVTFNYFKDPRDLQRCVAGMKTVIQVIESDSMANFRYPFLSTRALMKLMLALPLNLRPRHLTSSFSLEKFCRDTVLSIWHYHGGCHVDKVVDKDYKVIGIDGLRVVDGSTFFNSPGTNPQATVLMLGRYMGKRILQERFSSRKP